MPFWMERWRTPSLAAYAARLSQTRATPNGVFGAKLLYRQLLHLESLARQEPELAELPLAEILDRLFPNLHLIWVTREDKVRQAISWFKARQTGIWGQDQGQSALKLGRAWRLGDEPLQPGELAFDYDGIAALLRQAEAEDAAIGQFFTMSGVEPFRVVYEEFTPRPRYEETILALLRWLGVTPPPDLTLPNPRTIKLADDRTDEWVARFRELQSAGAPS
jgi:LPS sulfotransferase NodH